jgi:Peptidase M60, enhancin and enhancin-like/N-terminal domain of M60-like peptidases
MIMIRPLMALMLALLSLATPAGLSAAGAPSAPDDPRDALIEGVTTIAAPGAPGAIACWGERAVVVVVGREGGYDVPVVACSRHGSGRVVLLAHTGYFDARALRFGQTEKLIVNAVRWAGDAESNPGGVRVAVSGAPDVLSALKSAGIEAAALSRSLDGSSLESIDVLVRAGGLSAEEVPVVQKFIDRGGGFITAQCGWGWKQLSGDKEMLEFTVNHAVAPAGLAFTDGFAETTAPDGFDAVRKPTEFSHGRVALRAILEAAARAPDPAGAAPDLAAAGASATRALRVIPVSDIEFRPRINTLVEGASDRLTPSERAPLTEKSHAVERFLLAYQLERLRSLPPERIEAHPASSSFPGAVPTGASGVTRVVKIDTSIPDWHSLGLYARAGEAISVTVPSEAANGRLHVRIGCHTDENWHHAEWTRVPQIARRIPLRDRETRAASPFGGLVYIDVPRGSPLGVIEVAIAGAVEAPLFVLGQTDPDAWRETIRHFPGPWAELATSKVIITVPSERIRTLDDPAAVMEFWDRIMDAAADLATIPHARERPERYVADMQISAGYMHAGYPIMTHLDAGEWLPSLAELRSGNWGLYHELGHNHQVDDWTFDGTVEVTCNLFCLYIHDTLCAGGKTDSARWLPERRDDVGRHIARGAPFERWKSEPFTALAMYIQLQQAFGWETFKKVFAEYRDLPQDHLPRDDDQKRDQWMVRFSRACGRNLGPFFQAWGVPTSEQARSEIASLPGWMPEDWPVK